MEWTSASGEPPQWPAAIENYDAKARLAERLAERLADGDTVGVGSGSTSFLALTALAERARRRGWRFRAIVTSLEMEAACTQLDVEVVSLRQWRPDWSFDGADEVDPSRNMIKGRGGALLRERLVMASSPERYVVADATKLVERLGARHPVPLEVVPEALALVRASLAELVEGDVPTARSAGAKDGPVVTEHGNLLLDVRFPRVDEELEGRLRALAGVVATGLFFGFDPVLISEP